jgi:hypothetical protein
MSHDNTVQHCQQHKYFIVCCGLAVAAAALYILSALPARHLLCRTLAAMVALPVPMPLRVSIIFSTP